MWGIWKIWEGVDFPKRVGVCDFFSDPERRGSTFLINVIKGHKIQAQGGDFFFYALMRRGWGEGSFFSVHTKSSSCQPNCHDPPPPLSPELNGRSLFMGHTAWRGASLVVHYITQMWTIASRKVKTM